MNFSCRIAAVAGLSCALAGFATASAAAEADPSYPGGHWYVGSGIGPGFGAKYKLNGQTITFDDRLQGATDKSSLLGINLVNAGVAPSPTARSSAPCTWDTCTGADALVRWKAPRRCGDCRAPAAPRRSSAPRGARP